MGDFQVILMVCMILLSTLAEKVLLFALVGHPSIDGLNKYMLWGRCFITLISLAPDLFLSSWLKLDLNHEIIQD